MIGDIADEVELQSGRRQEGILFAAVGFMQKLNAGLGTFFAGQVLNFINFDRLNHTAEQAYSLAFVQGPVTTILMIVPIMIFSGYSLSASRHQEILQWIWPTTINSKFGHRHNELPQNIYEGMANQN